MTNKNSGVARRVRAAAAAAAGLGLVAAALPATLSASATESPEWAPLPSTLSVDEEVSATLTSGGTADVWINLAAAPDLSAAEDMPWDERGQYVHDRLTETARTSQADLVADLEADGVEYEAFWVTNSVFVQDADAALLTQAADAGAITSVEADFTPQMPDPVIEDTPPSVQDAGTRAPTWGLNWLQAPQIWSQYDQRGAGIVVGTFDTGVEASHPALSGKYRGTATGSHDYNWFDSRGASSTPVDPDGHGTHVTGTMVGGTGSNQIGVAPDARFIGSAGCCVSGADVISTFQWFLAPTRVDGSGADPSQRPHVINNSWGYGNRHSSLDSAMNAWTSAGIFHTWAAGNSGFSCNSVTSPAWNDAAAYVVANHTSTGVINNSANGPSSRGAGEDGGPGPDAAAPGTDVLSSVPGGGYASFSGTSMAAPHVAGSVALLWAEFPALVGDIPGTRALLDQASVDAADPSCGGPTSNNPTFGEGRLDLVALFEAAS